MDKEKPSKSRLQYIPMGVVFLACLIALAVASCRGSGQLPPSGNVHTLSSADASLGTETDAGGAIPSGEASLSGGTASTGTSAQSPPIPSGNGVPPSEAALPESDSRTTRGAKTTKETAQGTTNTKSSAPSQTTRTTKSKTTKTTKTARPSTTKTAKPSTTTATKPKLTPAIRRQIEQEVRASHAHEIASREERHRLDDEEYTRQMEEIKQEQFYREQQANATYTQLGLAGSGAHQAAVQAARTYRQKEYDELWSRQLQAREDHKLWLEEMEHTIQEEIETIISENYER